MSLGKVVKGGLWLYLSSLTNNITGFFYWLIISSLGGSSVLGITSAVVGFSTIITTILSLGIAVGIQRFIGLYRGEQNFEKIREYFWTSFYFRLIIYLAAGLILFILSYNNISIGGLKPEMLRATSFIIMINSLSLFVTVPVSFIKTKITFLSNVISQATKFIVGIILVYLGFGWIGAVLGSILYSITNLSILAMYTLKLIKPIKIFSIKALKDVVTAGISSWIPGMLATLAQQSGVLAVFGTSGASETGYYYVASAISGIILMLGGSMLTLLLPLLSSMKDGRKRANWRALRLSLAIMSPALSFILVYPWLPLSLLGKEYITASLILMILAIGGIPNSIVMAINSLIYSYGIYRYVFIIGLFQNLPKIFLYAILVPKYHGEGAALSVTLGSLIGLAASVVIARKISYRIYLREITYILSPPALIGLLCYLVKIPWIIGGVLILAFSIIIYIKLNIITRKDLKEISYSLIPEQHIRKITPYVKPILDTIYGV